MKDLQSGQFVVELWSFPNGIQEQTLKEALTREPDERYTERNGTVNVTPGALLGVRRYGLEIFPEQEAANVYRGNQSPNNSAILDTTYIDDASAVQVLGLQQGMSSSMNIYDRRPDASPRIYAHLRAARFNG